MDSRVLTDSVGVENTIFESEIAKVSQLLYLPVENVFRLSQDLLVWQTMIFDLIKFATENR